MSPAPLRVRVHDDAVRARAKGLIEQLEAATGRIAEITVADAAASADLVIRRAEVLSEGAAPAAVPARDEARDAAVTRSGMALHELPVGSRVGVDSPRRRAQLGIRAPYVEPIALTGPVEAQLRALDAGEVDAVVLAAADLPASPPVPGGRHRELLGVAEWPTDAGQGAFFLELAADAPADLRDAVRRLDDVETAIAVAAERAVVEGLGSAAAATAGVHAAFSGDALRLRAVVYAADGSSRIGLDLTESLNRGYIRQEGSGNGADAADGAVPTRAARAFGLAVSHRLLNLGAADLTF